jgi:hypothetical protein
MRPRSRGPRRFTYLEEDILQITTQKDRDLKIQNAEVYSLVTANKTSLLIGGTREFIIPYISRYKNFKTGVGLGYGSNA